MLLPIKGREKTDGRKGKAPRAGDGETTCYLVQDTKRASGISFLLENKRGGLIEPEEKRRKGRSGAE